MVSRRSLRHDPIFDALIAKLYPSREVYEKEQDDLLNQVIKKHHGDLLQGNKGRKSKHKTSDKKILDGSCYICNIILIQSICIDDGNRENGKISGSGVKRGFNQIESVTDEISIVLMGRNVERNKYITLKNDQDQLPKIGHVKSKFWHS